MPRSYPFLIWLVMGLSLWSCATTPPSSLRARIGAQPVVLVKSLRLPDTEAWYSRVAQHSWLDVRLQEGGAWIRLEVKTPHSGVTQYRISDADALADERWGRAIHVRRAVYGDGAVDLAKDAVRLTRDRKWPPYRAFPGPNSNTFVSEVLLNLPGIGATLDANAVGKDFALRIGRSETGAGVEADAWILGLQAGWREGLEVHLLGFTAGVGLLPFTIKLPLLPELRLGVGEGSIQEL